MATCKHGVRLGVYCPECQMVRELSEIPKTKSDGKSGSYYDIKIPDQYAINGDGYIKITAGDVMLQALDNDYDKSSIFKAIMRIGKKEGIDASYDLNKIEYHLERLRTRFN